MSDIKSVFCPKRLKAAVIIAVCLLPLLYFFLPKPPLPELPPVENQTKLSNRADYVSAVNKGDVHFQLKAQPWFLDMNNPKRDAYGDLTLNWAYSVYSDNPDFGGVSGLDLISASDNQTLLRAVTDAGHIFTFDLNTNTDTPTFAVTGFRPVLNRGAEKADSDAESVVVMPFGFDLVTYERQHRLMLGDVRLQNPKGFRDLPRNGGIEAAALLKDGRLMAVSENTRTGKDHHSLWVSDNPVAEGVVQQSYVEAYYQAPEGHSPTDLAVLPNGDILVLNRKYVPMVGVSTVIEKITLDSLNKAIADKQTTPLKGLEVLNLSNSLNIDNFEGMTVVPRGDHLELILVSDNNFRQAQKTLIVSFKMKKLD